MKYNTCTRNLKIHKQFQI